jgi:23S rRNA (guanosine2251-2'-O)-methyltransferase
MVIGKQAVLDAFQAGTQLDRIYITKDVRGMVAEEILSLALQHNVPVNKVPVEKLNGFNVTNHEGCLAIIAKVQYHDLQDIISHVVENG